MALFLHIDYKNYRMLLLHGMIQLPSPFSMPKWRERSVCPMEAGMDEWLGSLAFLTHLKS